MDIVPVLSFGFFGTIFATLLGGLLASGATLGISALTQEKPEEVDPIPTPDPERERRLRRQRGASGFMGTILTSAQGIQGKTKLGQ